MKAIINSTPDLIFYKDLNSNYLGCNKAFAEYLGIKQDEITGKTDYDYYPKHEAEVFINTDKKILETKQSFYNEGWVTHANGNRIYLDTIKSPFFNTLVATLVPIMQGVFISLETIAAWQVRPP